MSFRVGTVLLAALVAVAQSNAIHDPAIGSRVKRIIGGRNAQPNEYPWMVSIHFNDKYHCSAFLVTPKLVMTARHCSNDQNYNKQDPSKFTGYIGTNQADSGTKLRFTEIIRHAMYGVGGDISLWRLESPVTLNSGIQTICLPTQNSNYEGTTAQAMGWGKTQRGSKQGANILQTLTVPVTSKRLCFNDYGRVGIKLDASNICAGGEDNKGICNGDSGGPLVSFVPGKPVAIGVAAFVSPYGCASKHPDVYEATAKYTDWIKKTAGDEVSKLCFLKK